MHCSILELYSIFWSQVAPYYTMTAQAKYLTYKLIYLMWKYRPKIQDYCCKNQSCSVMVHGRHR
jgi:hypothetical protein